MVSDLSIQAIMLSNPHLNYLQVTTCIANIINYSYINLKNIRPVSVGYEVQYIVFKTMVYRVYFNIILCRMYLLHFEPI